MEVKKIPFLGGEKRVEKDLEQAHFAVGFEAPAITAPQVFAGKIFSVLMGGGMSSRLFQEIREKRGLVYSVSSYTSSFSDSGIFGVYAGTGQKEVKELMPVLCCLLYTSPSHETRGNMVFRLGR